MRFAVPQLRFQTQVYEALLLEGGPFLSTFEADDVVKLAAAVAQGPHTPPAAWFHAFCSRSAQLGPAMSTAQCSRLLFAVALMDAPPSGGWLSIWLPLAAARLPELPGDKAAHLLWSVGRILHSCRHSCHSLPASSAAVAAFCGAASGSINGQQGELRVRLQGLLVALYRAAGHPLVSQLPERLGPLLPALRGAPDAASPSPAAIDPSSASSAQRPAGSGGEAPPSVSRRAAKLQPPPVPVRGVSLTDIADGAPHDDAAQQSAYSRRNIADVSKIISPRPLRAVKNISTAK